VDHGPSLIASDIRVPAGRCRGGAPDGRRLLQLALATLWLLDGILQLQPVMFTPGRTGFSGMLSGAAVGNPGVVAQTITWNASVVSHHPVATNTVFALTQILLGFGLAWRPTVKAALAASVVWSMGVWWFGEGLGGVLTAIGTPIGGGPGAVLFYGLLAVLLWPVARAVHGTTFVAARAVGARPAKAIWAAAWGTMGGLTLVDAARSPEVISQLIKSLDSGQPGWLAAIDRQAELLVAHNGVGMTITFAVICLIVAVGPYLPAEAARATLVLAIVVSIVVWVVGENFGMIFPGGATDPNSGPLLVLLAFAYWPPRPKLAGAGTVAFGGPEVARPGMPVPVEAVL
jgi:hypothetical protein